MKKLFAALLVGGFIPAIAFAAPVFLSSSQATSAGDIKFNHTRHASAVILIVGCTVDENSITQTVTYGGNAMSLIHRVQPTTANTSAHLYFLASPPSGTNEVFADNTGTAETNCWAVDFSGAALSVPTGPTGTFNDIAAASTSINVTCASGNLAISIVGATSGANFTPNGTRIGTELDGSTSSAAMQYIAGAGVTAMTETTGSEAMAQAGACIVAAAPPTTIARPPIIVQ